MTDCWHVNHKCPSCKNLVFIISRGEAIYGLCLKEKCKVYMQVLDFRYGLASTPQNIRTYNMAEAFAQVMDSFGKYRKSQRQIRRRKRSGGL